MRIVTVEAIFAVLLAAQSAREAALKVDPFPDLQRLCDGIGPRLTGSAALEKAGGYVLARMKEIGLDHIHTEPWTLARGWQRGFATASLVAPFVLPMPVAAYGWTGSTPEHRGPVEVVLVDADAPVAQDPAWRGKVLLVSADPNKPMRAYSQLLPLLQAATAAHAIAVLRHDPRPGGGIHTEPIAVVLPEKPDPNLIPALDLAAEHLGLMERLLKSNRPVTMTIDVHNTFTPGPVTSNNVIGEIAGITRPEEIVVVGAHLDSWDLGTGAADDGFGASAVLGAARTLILAGVRPARTIRFVLFTGEEQGLLGSRAYVHAHSADKFVAVFALDWGAGPVVKLPAAGHAELLPLLTRFNEAASDFHLEPPDAGFLFMTDAYAFTLAGIPGIAPLVKDAGYAAQAHSAADTLDKVNPADLRQAMTVLAMSASYIADAPDLPPTRLTAAQTAASLSADGQETMLELFGLWPPAR
jgi:carboxypeptidase Q